MAIDLDKYAIEANRLPLLPSQVAHPEDPDARLAKAKQRLDRQHPHRLDSIANCKTVWSCCDKTSLDKQARGRLLTASSRLLA